MAEEQSGPPAACCDECGAALEGVTSCREHFHRLLLLEAEVPGGPGELAHFYGVASYGLQHPRAMGYTVSTAEGLRSAVRDVLAGTRDLEDVRRRVRFEAARAGRVTRRPGDPVPSWPLARWELIVTDVLARGAAQYRSAVEAWARSVMRQLP